MKSFATFAIAIFFVNLLNGFGGQMMFTPTVLLTRHQEDEHAPAATETRPTESQAIDRSFQQIGSEFVASDKADQLSIAAIKNGQVRFYNFGSASRTRPHAPTQLTIYEIGSITKLFTSLLLAHAVTEGKVELTDDIRRYLPGQYANLTFEGVPIRLIDLADTTSALPDNLPDLSTALTKAGPDEVPFVILKASQHYSGAQLLEDLKSVKLLDRPGTAPHHSNLAAALLAIILERVYGETYETLLARYVEKPFAMNRGTGRLNPALLASGYNEPHVPMPPLDARSILAAGGLRYSAADMARFLSAELTASETAIRLSQQPAWGDPDKTAVGFNWILSRTIDGKPRLQASGGTFGFSSYIEMYPDLDYGIVLLANRSGQTQDELQHLADRALKEVFGKPPVQTALEQALEAGAYLDVSTRLPRYGMLIPSCTCLRST